MRKKAVQASSLKKLQSSASDKWVKSKLLSRDTKLKKYLPPDKLMTKQNLGSMISKWGMVYAKPTRGSQGNGVMKVGWSKSMSGSGGRKLMYQLGEKKRSFPTLEEAYRSILKDTKGKTYILQKGINLLKHKGLSFDIRLVVQKSPRGVWEATGTLGRVAHPRKIVTNGSQGGTIYPTAYLLAPYTSPMRRRRMLNQMNFIGLRTAKSLQRSYPGIKELGIDLAIDRRLKPWILEVNTVPDPCPFTFLDDQSMLRKIVKYARAYGKTYKLNCKKAKRGII